MTTTEKDPRHGLPSASAVYRHANCLGSYRMSKGVPEFKTPEMEEWAASGDRIHDALARNTINQLGDEDERDVAHLCAEQRDHLVSTHVEEKGDDLITRYEERMWLYPDDGRLYPTLNLSGQPDLVVVNPTRKTGIVVDYKTNRGGQVDSESNRQLRTLIVLSAEKWPGIETWAGAIVQPLVTSKPVVVLYNVEDVANARKELISLLRAIDNPTAPTSAGLHCKFCPAILKCDSAKAMLKTFGLIEPDNAEGETLAKYLVLAKSAEPIIKRLQARAKQLLTENPNSVPGWTLGKSQTMRSITDTLACFKLLKEAGLIDSETFMRDAIGVGLGDLEKAVAAFAKLPKKKAADAINSVCVPIIEFKPKAPPLEQID